jgi:hypothetical protein
MKKKSFYLLLFTSLLLAWFFAYMGDESNLAEGINNAIRSDGLGYYAWTQFFMEGQNLCFDDIRVRYENYSPQNAWVIKPIENSDCFLPIYPFGMGLILIPFFLIALAISGKYQIHEIDALSTHFQIMVSTSSTIFVTSGLYLFRKLIFLYFPFILPIVANFIVISLLLGSNLLHYATYDGIFSHGSSFFVNSIILFLTIKTLISKNLSRINLFLLGFLPLFGMTIRPTNVSFILFTVLVLFVVVKNRDFIKLKFLVIGFISGLLIIFLQILLWKISTGTFFYFTYYDYEGFSFQPFTIFRILFSFNPHGLLPWSPILVLALLGALGSYKFSRPIFLTSVTVFAINSIAFASWTQPYGGGAFGNRLYIDLYPLLFIPIAMAFLHINKRLLATIFVFSVLANVVTLHLTYQYWKGEIDFGGIPLDQYIDQISEMARFIYQ